MLHRVLNGMRYTYEEAGGIWEDVDPYGSGGYSSMILPWSIRLPARTPAPNPYR